MFVHGMYIVCNTFFVVFYRYSAVLLAWSALTRAFARASASVFCQSKREKKQRKKQMGETDVSIGNSRENARTGPDELKSTHRRSL